MQKYGDFYLIPTNLWFFAQSLYDNCRFSTTDIFYP